MSNRRENREYRSDVFSLLLQEKSRALEIYNALNGTAYTDPEMIEIVPMENRGISLSVRNDASFVLDVNLSIYEHQSTICPNIPLRELIYFTNIIHARTRKKNIYGKTLIRIPTPHFAVFYNGTDDAPERYELKLSDAFEKKTKHPEIELICQFYNINKGHNVKLLEQCPTLRDYTYFVDLVRAYHEKNDFNNLADAIELAIDQCTRENILKNFLTEHRSEVMKMMQLDYTFERQIELEREEAIEEGWKKGMEQNTLDLIRKKLAKNKPLEQIADELETAPEIILPLFNQLKDELTEKQINFTMQ